MKKIMTIFGTRPEGIKMAPLVNALKHDSDLECVVVNTAQHREMLDQVLELFEIIPDYDLDCMKSGQTPQSLTAEMTTRLSDIIDKEKPDLILVHGDTTTTFVGAYSAFLKQIPVGHVEAGLRTNNIYSPFPEEMNRQLVGRLSTIHFAATEKNKENLLKENVQSDHISVVGNTVIDALLDITKRPFSFDEELCSFLHNGNKTILMTTHRRENMEQMKGIYDAVNTILENNTDVQVLFPIHKNPAIREKVNAFLSKSHRVRLIEPLDYETFAHTMKKVDLIITDSGGIQEEAPALGKPVLVVRHDTERQEGVDAGTLKLVGTSADKIFMEAHELLNNPSLYSKTSAIKNPYGDGTTSKKIVRIIKEFLN